MNKKGFSLTELTLAGVIAGYIAFGAWAVFIASRAWWEETIHWVDAERISRVALDCIAYGINDATAGADTIGSLTLQKRGGILGAMAAPTLGADRIDFALEPDAGNTRAFYMAQVPGGGRNAIYYQSDTANAATAAAIPATLGITDIGFSAVDGDNNLIRVTAIVTETIQGTRPGGYTVSVTLEKDVCLRNF